MCGPDFACTMIINGLEVGQVVRLRRQACAHRADAPGRTPAGSRRPEPTPSWCAATGSATTWPATSRDAALLPRSRPSPLENFPKEYYAKEKGAGANTLLAAGIKKEVSIPVIVVGRLDADLGEKILDARAWPTSSA